MKTLYLSFLAAFLFFTNLISFAQVPALSSNPGSAFVLLVDMDGHTDSSGWWGTGIVLAASPNYSSSQCTEVFNRVSEDYRPFDINVTTQQSVFNAAPIANRQRVVITPSDGFYNINGKNAGGVAYLNTFGGGNISCWVFSNKMGGSVANAAEAASHELGHTLGLNHHARFNSNCSFNTEYHSGQGSGQTSWAPIMGTGYGRNITQWYHGPANSSLCTSNIQDDLKVITTNNGFDYRTDDVGNSIGSASSLAFVGNSINTTKLISTNTDFDFFKLTITTAGVYKVMVSPYAISTSSYAGANLDARLKVFDGSGNLITDADPISTLDASASLYFIPGDYYISVDGSGISNYIAIGGVGKEDYGSIGQYNLSVSSQVCSAGFVSTTSGERCGSGSVTISAVPVSGGTVSWYAASTGGTSLSNGNSYISSTISATTTFFAEVSNGVCISERIPVNAIISTAPVLSVISGPTTVQVGNTIQLAQTSNLGTWTSSNPNVVTVSQTGLVTALAQGTGSVVISYSASIGSCPIAIVNSTISITIPGPCPGTPTVSDVDGNVYNTILIGNQCWTKENLKTTKFADASPIPSVTLDANWSNLSSGAWCNYANSNQNEVVYGKIYNGFSIVNSKGLCPIGWHIPDQNEYSAAFSFLGGMNVAGGKMKSTSSLWNLPNVGASNFSGLSVLPGGQRSGDGSFTGLGSEAGLWTVSTSGSNTIRYVLQNNSEISSNNLNQRNTGQSVRCVQDPAGSKVPTINFTYGGTSCGPSAMYLNAYASSGFVNWYTSAQGGTPFYTGNSYQTPILNATTIYYVEAVFGVLVSSPRTPVTATIKPIFNPGSLSIGDESVCSSGDPSPISFEIPPLSADSIAYQWYYQDGIVACPTGNSVAGWILISGANGNFYDPPAGLIANRTYAVLVTPLAFKSRAGQGGVGGGETGLVCGTATWANNCRKVSVLQIINYGSLAQGDQILNNPADPALISFSNSPTGGSGNFNFQWYSQIGLVSNPTGSSTLGWTIIQGANSPSYDPPAGLSQSITYACFVSPSGNPVCGLGAWSNGVRQITVICNLLLSTPTTINGPAGVCRSVTNQVFTTPEIAGATSYVWTLPAGASGSSSTNSISVSISSTFVTGNICVKPANACLEGASFCRSLVYYSGKPATPGNISGPTTGVCANSTQVYTIAAVTNASNYTWTAPTNASIISGQGTTTVTVSFNASFVSGTLSLNASNCISGTSANKTLAISSKPGTPVSIVGIFKGACAGSNQTYACPAVAGATIYNWTLPAGTAINSGSGTNNINVTLSAIFTSGTISVSAGNSCGNSSLRSATILSTPSTPTSISGPINGVCNGTVQNYICPVSTSGATSYNWTVPVGSTINSGQGTNAINVTIPASYISGTISVKAGNTCGNSSARSVTVRSVPSIPGTITGTASNLCSGGIFSYSIVAISGANSYNWIPPLGCSIQTNTGTAITLLVPAGFISGSLSVSATNGCGTSPVKTLALVGKPGTPSAIIGSASVCPSALGVPFSTASIAGLTYTWTVPSTVTVATGQGTASATMNWGVASGIIYVKATNSCGTSSNISKSISLATCSSQALNQKPFDEIGPDQASTIVYPNPGIGIYRFRINGKLSNASLKVYNMQGKEISSQQIDDQTLETSLNLENQPPGTYLVRYQSSLMHKEIKVVKE